MIGCELDVNLWFCVGMVVGVIIAVGVWIVRKEVQKTQGIR